MKPNGDSSAAPSDAAVLFPDVDVTVRDPDTGATVTLTVREFRFLEGLQLAALIRPLIESIGMAVNEDDEVDHDTIAAAMTDHADVWLESVARATGRDADWIGRLSDSAGQALSAAMWSVNGFFFGRRVIEAVRRRRQDRPFPSPTSSMPSSGPDTAADTETSPSG